MPNLPAKWRTYLYAVSVAAVPLLVAYGVIDDSTAPLWIAAAGAVINSSLALRNVTPDSDTSAG